MDAVPRSPFLVYTSAGDRSAVSQWRSQPGNFELFITYYGDVPGALRGLADFYNERKGVKFPNLQHAYRTWPQLFAGYRAVLVMDDDVLISPRSIDRLFSIREEFDYAVLQPAYTPWGKVSHNITRVRRDCLKRHTNFVEMTCPLFEQTFLARFMKEYEPEVESFGIDWWFLHTLSDLEGRVAIIDEITCTNPHDYFKEGLGQEIDFCDSPNERIRAFERVRQQKGIKWDYMSNSEKSHLPDYLAQCEYTQYLRRFALLWKPIGRLEQVVAESADRWYRRFRGLPFHGTPFTAPRSRRILYLAPSCPGSADTFEVLRKAFDVTLVTTGVSHGRHFSAEVERKLRELLAQDDYGLIICDTLDCAHNLRRLFHCRTLLLDHQDEISRAPRSMYSASRGLASFLEALWRSVKKRRMCRRFSRVVELSAWDASTRGEPLLEAVRELLLEGKKP